MEQDDFQWMQKWYSTHCDGDWEHSNGIHIETIDNPGWSIKINVLGTELENKQFNKVHIERSEHDWIFCSVQEGNFEGACGSLNLHEVLRIFRAWAEQF
jgi:hypothetical protein